jgi:hypothetical protein
MTEKFQSPASSELSPPVWVLTDFYRFTQKA